MAISDTITNLGTAIIGLANKRAKTDLSNITSAGETVIQNLASGVPVGTVIAYMGTTVPDGFLLMSGQNITVPNSSTDPYYALYQVVGFSMGGSSALGYFTIADMTDGRYLMGSTVAGSSVPIVPPIARTDFGNAKFYYASASSTTITETSILSTTATGDSCLASPNNITFTTTTKNANYSSLILYMRGYDSDGSTILFDQAIGYIPSSCYGTVGNTYTFNIASSYQAYFFQFYIVGVTTTAKQTVAGNITVDYFIHKVKPTGLTVSAGLPNITGDFNSWSWKGDSYIPTGAFYKGAVNKQTYNASAEGTGKIIGFNASRSNSIYGNSTTVTPESLAVSFVIKY